MTFKGFSLDGYIFIITAILSFLGLVNFFSISLYYSFIRTESEYSYFFDFFTKNFLLGWLIFFIANFLGNRFSKIKVIFYLAFFILYFLLWLTLLTPLGVEINNAKRWLMIGPLVFQPSELIKPFSILVLSLLLISNPRVSVNVRFFFPLIFTLLVALPIYFQPAGSNSFIIASSIFISSLVFFPRISLIFRYLIFLILIGGFFIFIGIYLWPYRQERILFFLNQGDFLEEETTHIEQSQLAISSGGFLGKGLGKSEAKYLPLPKMLNDSVFSIYAEEFGFIGSIILLLLFAFLFLRILRLGLDNPYLEKKSFCLGVFVWFLTQTSLHLLSNLGLFVPTGVILPFFSSGASGQLAIYFSLGLISSFRR